MGVAIEIDHVIKRYGDHTVINGLSVDIRPGEFFTLLGPSGCGKTTLLRMIIGFNTVEGGQIRVDGQVVNNIPTNRRNMGMVFQNYAVFPHMNVRDNVAYGLKTRRIVKTERRKKADEMLKLVKIDQYADRMPSQLSGGQQQRTALARILVGKPNILMLDEPFSALDSYLREEVEGEVGSLLAGFAGTALLVTHNRDEAYRLCRDMIVMDGGQVLRTGTTKEVFADPRSIAAARLTGCKNILPCTRVDAHSVRLAGCESLLHLAAEVPEGCTAVGIRAHDFAPCAPGAENALPVELLSASENPFDWNLIFQLPDGTTRLWWKVSKTTLSVAEPDAPACLSALPESIMALVDHK